ncbi:MAG: DUF5030 domain-containing protein [Bacteroides sp.]|nr:DUF5030 domain-containing protein [Bacteroides sp.]MCM1447828.1 DUF5030 domain-containing protein [Bacteroides sp.]
MKTFLSITLTILSIMGAYGQNTMSFSDMEGKWNEWLLQLREPYTLHSNHFKDTVSLQEMKEAFYRHKDDKNRNPQFGDRDTVKYIMSAPGIVLKSTLDSHPDKKVRDCRATWLWYKHNPLFRLFDKNGIMQKKLLEQLNKKQEEWLDGEFVTLDCPVRYMGFTISPCPGLTLYHNGEKVGGDYAGDMHLQPDFFEYAFSNVMILGHPSWTSGLGSGIRALGSLHELRAGCIRSTKNETTFSVLLYANPQPQKRTAGKFPAYTLELLEPEDADKETMLLFNSFKETIEQIPVKAFRNYYTTDFRIMTGRYYHVTVNKCGWLVEDYFDLNRLRK